MAARSPGSLVTQASSRRSVPMTTDASTTSVVGLRAHAQPLVRAPPSSSVTPGAHLTRVLAGQPEYAPLSVGEIVTTGTLTDAWPIASGEHWQSDYGPLGIDGLTAAFS